MTQIVLYTYPLWAFVAFIASLAYFVDYIFVTIPRDTKTLIWGFVFLGWSIAFFGAGLLIAEAVERSIILPLIQGTWVITFPFFVIVVAIKCWVLWCALRKIDRHGIKKR